MDIAGGVPKVHQSLPKVEAIGDLVPLMQAAMCHIGHCHAPVLLRLHRIRAMSSWAVATALRAGAPGSSLLSAYEVRRM
jgi:hypothetical protein